MNKLDELKAKVEDLKKREGAIANSEHIIKALSGIYKSSLSQTKEAVANNNLLFLEQISKNVETKIEKGSQDVSEALHKFSTDNSNGEIAKELGNLLTEVRKLQSKKYFDQTAFDKLFVSSIDKINNIIVSNSEVPSNTRYTRNGAGDIIKVTETYDEFTLRHTWSYDEGGNLSNVSTTKTNNETK